MALADFCRILWRERELLELLLFKLEEEQLVLSSGRARWLAHATREVEAVLEQIRDSERVRSLETDVVAMELGLGPGPSLVAVARSAPEPYAGMLAQPPRGLPRPDRRDHRAGPGQPPPAPRGHGHASARRWPASRSPCSPTAPAPSATCPARARAGSWTRPCRCRPSPASPPPCPASSPSATAWTPPAPTSPTPTPPGYSRQRVTMEPTNPATTGTALFSRWDGPGTGVRVTDIQRVSDELVTARVRQERSTAEFMSVDAAAWARLEVALGEPGDTGLTAAPVRLLGLVPGPRQQPRLHGRPHPGAAGRRRRHRHPRAGRHRRRPGLDRHPRRARPARAGGQRHRRLGRRPQPLDPGRLGRRDHAQRAARPARHPGRSGSASSPAPPSAPASWARVDVFVGGTAVVRGDHGHRAVGRPRLGRHGRGRAGRRHRRHRRRLRRRRRRPRRPDRRHARRAAPRPGPAS